MTAENEQEAVVLRREVFRELAEYQKRGRISYDVASMSEMIADESDRGVVVILGSLLEDLLLERLLKRFIGLAPKAQKDLVRGGGPLSSQFQRIALAQALGLIDEDMFQMLEVIRAMRNACAHSRRDIDFRTPELRNALALLFEGENADAVRAAQSEVGLRLMFVIAFVWISTILSGETIEVATAKSQKLIDAALVEAGVRAVQDRQGKKDQGKSA